MATRSPVSDVDALAGLFTSHDRRIAALERAPKGTSSGGGGTGVPSTRRIDTQAPLAGGGDLSVDRTLTVATFTAGARGVAPASGGGTVNYLRADGTWAPVPTGGDEVFVGPADPGGAYELWFDTDANSGAGQLYVRVAGAWIPATVGGVSPTDPGLQEVFVGPADPGTPYELWYDTDAVAPTVGLIPAGGAAGTALVKTSAADFAVGWGTVPRPANVPWGVVAMANQGTGNNVIVGATGPTYLHPALVFTFLAGRQYKICWSFRAVARQDNSASPAASNLRLYDSTTDTGIVDHWFHFAGQWKSFNGEMPFTAVGAKSYRLGYGNQAAPLSIYASAAWVEDIGPVV